MDMKEPKMQNKKKKKEVSFKTKVVLAAGSIVSAIASRSDGTVNRRLLNIADLYTPPSSIPINGVKSFDYTFDVSRQLWFRLFIPEHATYDQLPVIIYFHGGGFVQYSPSTTPYDTICRRIAGSASAVVISATYRLAPEHKLPAQYHDGFDVLKFVDGEMMEKVADFPASADLRRCFLAGDSSGGNVAHHLAVKCGGTELKRVKICGMFLIQPGFGGEVRTESEIRLGNKGKYPLRKTDLYWKSFLPNESDRDHPAVNVFGRNSLDEDTISKIGYPSTLVLVGGLDSMIDRQRWYVDGLKRCGKVAELVVYPDAYHGFYGATDESTEFDLLIAKVSKFVQNHSQLAPEPLKTRDFNLSRL